MSTKVSNGKVIEMSYRLMNAKGEVLDQADSGSPFAYLHGAQQIVPGLESAIEGLSVGDKKNVVVQPEEGYGEVNPALKLVVTRAQFPTGVELKTGMQFEAQGGDGEGLVFMVENIEGDSIHINGNHPLAGETLHFAIEILKVRDATEEEKEHGHAHGGDGHQH
ncbi:MAG: peptidylprolyl isomerase [Oligoflexia bacterium]|nr:peptidylprolyl isomerase [Oligoflexia bacterium]